MKTGQPVVYVLREKHPYMHLPPVENPMCADLEEFKEVPGMATLDLSEGDITWVTSKLSGADSLLGSEEIELISWLLCFACTSEEFRVIVADLDDWMANSPSPPGPHTVL